MTTITINTLEAKEEFSELLSRVSHHKERIIITRREKEIAALIPIEDWDLLQSSRCKQVLQQAVESLKEARNMGSISLEQLKNQLGDS